MSKASFLVFCLMFFTVSFGVAAVAALIPSIALYFGVSPETALGLTWFYMLPYGLFALFWAPLTRIIKVKNIFLFTTAGFFFSSLFFCLSSSIQQAFFFRFFMGCFGCSFVPLTLITVAKTVSASHKAKYIGIFFSLSYLSSFISVFLSGFLYWRIIYFIPAVLTLILFVLLVFLLSEFDFRKEKFKISYIDTLKDKQALKFFMAVILGSFLYHSLHQRLGIYLNKTYALSQAGISSIFTVITLTAIIFEFLGGFLSSRFGSIRITRIGFISMSIFVLSLLFIFKYQMIFWVIILWGMGWSLTHVGLSSYLTILPDRVMRDASSLNSAFRFSFGGLGAFTGSLLVSLIGFNVLFLIVGAGMLLLGVYVDKMIS